MQKRRHSESFCIEDALICKICFEYLSVPVLQCTNGHLVCNTCLKKLADQQCPTCRQSIQKNIRNMVMEKLLEICEIQCKFKGCEKKLSIASSLKHFVDCKFNFEVTCPMAFPDPFLNYAVCREVVNIKHIEKHLKSKHNLEISLYRGFVDWGRVQLAEYLTIIVKAYKINGTICITALNSFEDNFEITVIPITLKDDHRVKMRFKSNNNYSKYEKVTHGLRSPYKLASFLFNYNDLLTYSTSLSLISKISID